MLKKLNEYGTLIQTICTIPALVIAIIALLIASNTYKHSAKTFSADLAIEKNNNFISIKNKDTDIFDISSIMVEGVDTYWCNILNNLTEAHFVTFYYLRDIKDDDSPNLNNIKIDTTKIHQLHGNIIEQSEQEQFRKNLENAIYNLSDIGMTAEYKETVYYIYITYHNKYDFDAKTLCLRCTVDRDGSFSNKVPWDTTYKKEENFFDLLHYKSQFSGKWNDVIDWLKN